MHDIFIRIMRILIIKTSALGDIVQTFPLLSYLKMRFPDALIDWVVEERMAELVHAHPLIHRVLALDTKAVKKHLFSFSTWKKVFAFRKAMRQVTYDMVYDVQGNCKSALFLWSSKAKVKIGFGRKSIPELPAILFSDVRINPPSGKSIRDDYMSLAQTYLKDTTTFLPPVIRLKSETPSKLHLKGQLRFMICPGSIWPNKQLSFDALKEFMKCLESKFSPHFILVWGCAKEKEVVQALKECFKQSSTILDKISLGALQNLMEQMDVVISVDSLPLHLAATTNTSTFSVFGPSSKDKYAPSQMQHGSIQGVCPYGRTFEKRCPILRTCPTGACIRNLKGAELFEKFCHFWNSLTSR